VKLLLENGAEVDELGPNGATDLLVASESGSLNVVEALVKHGASIDLADNDGEYGSGQGACGASVDKANNDGWTALMKACASEHEEMISVLLESNASVDKQLPYGYSALHLRVKEASSTL
jgi:ankyrin repeat protein